eukprot:CAMPEP_0172487116 /NCGR_PEP_ID=MMETSP1066-20121228/16020_1 /TAXON_ID=671091 /ORGANISM="Coscinodiscus wailesii, Strain CCMP2513" /LENGTH=56 /DNA_ID=CAMNT_0013253513 /DNA_START=306 /DNA_END=473 /DNA_ORIENTATION=+
MASIFDLLGLDKKPLISVPNHGIKNVRTDDCRLRQAKHILNTVFNELVHCIVFDNA